MNKPTLILGASPNPERYAFKATKMLSDHNHDVYPVGLRKGEIEGHTILTDTPALENIHTVTLYVGPKNQPVYVDYILNTIKPKRIIFNPGTENEEFEKQAEKKGILTERSCTLVLLSINNY